MVNLYQLAKDRMNSKNMDSNSKLDHSDIRDLIIIAMVDGILTSQEIAELKQIDRYSLWNMRQTGEKFCTINSWLDA